MKLFSLCAAALTALVVTTPALAGPKCETDKPKMDQEKVKAMYEQKGYQIEKFKVSKGGCYEIYGRQAGRKVEVYIDPVDASEVQKNVQ